MHVSRHIQCPAQRAAIVFDTHQHADAALARLTGAIQAVDIVGDQQFMFAVEQLQQLVERA
jgi:hypothetical protein